MSRDLSRAELLEKRGELEAAARCYASYIRQHPGDSAAVHRLAMLYVRIGDFVSATKAFRKAVDLSPRNASYRNDLGAAYLSRKQWELAERCFREALAISPDYVQVRCNLGHAMVGSGRIDEAIECFRSITISAPQFVDAHFNLGKLLQENGALELALGSYERALELRPDLGIAHTHIGEIHQLLGRAEAAIRSLRQALRLLPGHVDTLLALAEVLTESSRADEAIPLIEEVLKLRPDSVQARLKLGRAREVEGNLAAAEQEYRIAVGQSPNTAGGWLGLSSAKRFSDTDLPEIRELEKKLINSSWDNAERSVVHFALGKMLDDCRRFDEAFEHYRSGNDLRRGIASSLKMDTAGLTAAIVSQFTSDFLRSKEGVGNPTELPVFIVGMPRSGTTLTEQIIASHRDAHGAGELAYISRVAHGLRKILDSASGFPQICAEIDVSNANLIIAPYLELLRWHSATARRVTDKMPTNYRYLGLIAILFPNARIIHCERDPMDTCLSIYFQSFAKGHEYSYDLTEIGENYRHYRQLMDHWQRVMPSRIHTVRYEELTADPEPTARALIAACGLDWDDACLSFDKTRRQVRTASIAQVREGIYTRSRERWRNYERHLGPLKAALGLD